MWVHDVGAKNQASRSNLRGFFVAQMPNNGKQNALTSGMVTPHGWIICIFVVMIQPVPPFGMN